jgi:hypothetical protein
MLVTKEDLSGLSVDITKEQLENLTDLLIRGSHVITCSTVAEKLGIEPSYAIAIMICLDSASIVDTYLMVYHSCSEEAVDYLPFGEGFPRTPFTCPNCKDVIENVDHLSYTFGMTRISIQL